MLMYVIHIGQCLSDFLCVCDANFALLLSKHFFCKHAECIHSTALEFFRSQVRKFEIWALFSYLRGEYLSSK